MTFTIHTGDCREIMATLPESSVDTIICDPPYGLAFMGKDWDQQVPGPDYWRAALRVAKPGAMLLAFGGTRTFHRLTVAIEDAGWEVRDVLSWLYGSGFPKSMAIDKAIDKAAGAAREVLGHGAPRKDESHSLNKSGMGVAGARATYTAPATDLAKRWLGWGTALKPAWEPIILAMKPLDGTFADNAQRHGVAGLAIDAGRVGNGPSPSAAMRANGAVPMRADDGTPYTTSSTWKDAGAGEALGRWPANVLLDEVAAAQLDEQSGVSESPDASRPIVRGDRTNPIYGGQPNAAGTIGAGYGDTGGASRFFYVAKASRSDRGTGNDHPTVKPIDLMRYLCRLTKTPTGGVVLDPFTGSGSTGVAALIEGRDFIGCELDPHNAGIARHRCAEADPIGTQQTIGGVA